MDMLPFLPYIFTNSKELYLLAGRWPITLSHVLHAGEVNVVMDRLKRWRVDLHRLRHLSLLLLLLLLLYLYLLLKHMVKELLKSIWRSCSFGQTGHRQGEGHTRMEQFLSAMIETNYYSQGEERKLHHQ